MRNTASSTSSGPGLTTGSNKGSFIFADAPLRGCHPGRRRGRNSDGVRWVIRLLPPAGILATFSCSHHVSPALFEDVLRAAAADAGRDLRLLATFIQALDHPLLLTVPETLYLKGRVFQVM